MNLSCPLFVAVVLTLTGSQEVGMWALDLYVIDVRLVQAVQHTFHLSLTPTTSSPGYLFPIVRLNGLPWLPETRKWIRLLLPQRYLILEQLHLLTVPHLVTP